MSLNVLERENARLKILLVDDDEWARSGLYVMLQHLGHDIIEAADGVEAIEFLECQSADLVLLDILMPRKDGIETLAEIRRRWPSMKVISMSGGGYYCDPRLTLETSVRLGAVKGLEKPFSVDDLNSAIQLAMGHALEPLERTVGA